MLRFLTCCLFAALPVLALTGARLDYLTLIRMGILAMLVAMLVLVLVRESMEHSWTRYVLALAFAGFANLSGAMSYSRQTLGTASFLIFHAVAIAGLIFILLKTLHGRVASSNMNNPPLSLSPLDMVISKYGALIIGVVVIGRFVHQRLSPGSIQENLLQALALGGFIALFLVCSKCVRSRQWEVGFSLALLLALAFAGALGFSNLIQLRKTLKTAEIELDMGDTKSAQDLLMQAQAANQTLRWKPLDSQMHRLRADIHAAEGRHDQSLKEMSQYLLIRRKPAMMRAGADLRLAGLKGNELYQFYTDYLAPKPLDLAYENYSKPSQIDFFARIHEGNPQERAEDMKILLSFARNGHPDRLAERYASLGFPDIPDIQACEEALSSCLQSRPTSNSLDAWYLLGLSRFRAGKYTDALAAFDKALEIVPTHHNAITMIERIAAILERRDLLEQTRRKERLLTLEMMAGNRKWGYTVDDALWTAFEANPGTYRLVIRVFGMSGLGIDPRLSVFWGNSESPAYRSEIKSGKWHTIRLEKHFDTEGCHRFLLSFDNDAFCRTSDGRIENRSVQFEPIKVEHFPDIMLDTSGAVRQN